MKLGGDDDAAFGGRRARADARAAPDSALETPDRVMAVWAKVFGHEDSLRRNPALFLDYGGDSLFAAGVVSELRRLPVFTGLGMADLYAHPTIRGLAKLAAPATPAVLPVNKLRPGGAITRKARCRPRS